MIWSVRQAGVDHHIFGIVNERNYLEALTVADARYSRVIDLDRIDQFATMTITLVVEPGETQRERRRNRR